MAHHEESQAVAEFEATMEQAVDGYEVANQAFYEDPTFWVLISFTFFIVAMLFFNLPKMIGSALDKRSEGISNQLDEARKLREEAQALLASYERQQREAEGEAQEILEHAQAEADRIAKEAEEALAVSIARREALAQDKITQAEAAAVKEVRNVAVDVAIATARKLVSESLAADRADAMIDKSIADLNQHLN